MKFLNVFIFTFFMFIISPNLSGQTFQKTFGSVIDDEGIQTISTYDNCYLIISLDGSGASGLGGVSLIKTDTSGNPIWKKTYSTPGLYFHYGYSVRQTTDSGYIMAGSLIVASVGTDVICLIKTNSLGDTLWTKAFGGPPNPGFQRAYAYDIAVCSDHGFIVTGVDLEPNENNIYLLKTDSVGNVQWAKSYGGTGNDEAYTLKQTSDGGYVLCGYTNSFGAGGYDLYLLKVNSSGNIQWTKTFGNNRYEEANDIDVTNDGGFVLTGYNSGFGTGGIYDKDLFLLRTDSDGSILWSYTYGGDQEEIGKAVKQTDDGGFIVIGSTNSSGAGQEDVYLIKTDSAGNVIWSATYGGAATETGNDVIQNGSYYVITGATRNFSHGLTDIYLIKTDSLGNNSCQQDTATSIRTGLTWIESSGGIESNGYTIKSSTINIINTDTSSYNACVCIPPSVTELFAPIFNECIDFVDLSTWADEWFWDFGDGDTSTLQNPHHCWLNGIYNVCVTVSNDCGSDTYCDSVWIYTNIQDIKQNSVELEAIPNPFVENTTIKFENKLNEKLNLQIVNLIGEIIWTADNIVGESLQIENINLSPGVYYVQLLRSNRLTGVCRLIKQ